MVPGQRSILTRQVFRVIQFAEKGVDDLSGTLGNAPQNAASRGVGSGATATTSLHGFDPL
jgi:hypothetical protein